MQIIKYKGWRLLVANDVGINEAQHLFDLISARQYSIKRVLKNNQRSSVESVSAGAQNMVYKIPKEKNSRPWIRFMSLFRQGEAFRNIRAMQWLQSLDVKTTTPVMAAEKRQWGMVTDSWLLYHYLDGVSCHDTPETYPGVIASLQKLHAQGITHGDPQIRNFIKKDKVIYMIDANPVKVGITGFDIGYEWAYLRKSSPGIESIYGDILSSFWYKFAYQYDLFDRKMAHFRRRVRKSLRIG